MKKLFTLFAFVLFTFGCTKNEVEELVTAGRGRTILGYDPTTVDFIEPYKTLGGTFSTNGWIFNGTTIPYPVITTDSVTLKYVVHIGTYAARGKYRADQLDSLYVYTGPYNILHRQAFPNGGVMGDYEFTTRIPTPKVGLANGWVLDVPNWQDYNYDWITVEVHSAVTNGFGDRSIYVKTLKN